jgi:S-adenosylhomocysteine hydrolase
MSDTRPECSQETIPRSCADAFQDGAERMKALETKHDATAKTIDKISGDVEEIKTLVAQGRGLAFAGKLIFGAVGALMAWVFKR